jgi:hypothetical protein
LFGLALRNSYDDGVAPSMGRRAVAQVKGCYDPENLFRINENIGIDDQERGRLRVRRLAEAVLHVGHVRGAGVPSVGIPAELHVYDKSEHGFGVCKKGQPIHAWAEACVAWLRGHGVLKPGR